MPNLQDEAKAYIESVLGVAAQMTPVPLRVPYTIRDSYKTYELSVPMGNSSAFNMMLLVSRDDIEYPGIVKLQKHIELVRNVTNQVVVYVCWSLSTQDRRSLIMHQVNFIQPSFQMFIPEMALDLRESFRQRREQSEVAALLPAAQAMLLSCLYAGIPDETYFTTNALLGDLGYSRVTLSKAVDQLISLGVITPAKSELPWRTYAFNGSPAEVFQKAKKHLRSPVKKRIGITRNAIPMAPGVFIAGETALAKYTMLAEPKQAVWGMSKKVFNDMLALDAFEVVESVDTIEEWVEIWGYPSLTETQYMADTASLFLSLEDNPDERIQIALDELKEQVRWLA
ncbi:hypothetical protein MX621_30925 (plasmid) [Pseudomonas aeruginosa]|jgi:hypothetical protein|uniref:MarR family transcriptional regulator n=2 Tax=Pseudomonas TaxID=286 RepID=A0A3M4JV67_9PSED|nr:MULTISPECIES: hypothetical protein [Pseudomonas]MCT8191192.1 hypothetical protein [Pseudomonas monteilii]RFQ05770.1 hypothetical protein D0O09_03150 [Pseudomonas putida]MDM3951019.1 hypothetical protein [Pseudomonas alloputida]RMQ20929.1 hypothetical protein ALQ08_200109 [Pseudomonas syringae pv. delphinii]UPL41691.1 hypothetical protein MX621_30925 [Pseudomonas aeruginosa]